MLLEVVYDPASDSTRVVVAGESREWPRRLSRFRGWQRVQD
jgi:hypothetical protein